MKNIEIDYLENKIKELEKTIEILNKKRFTFGSDISSNISLKRNLLSGLLNPVCTKCGTKQNVEFIEELHANLCNNCKGDWH